MRLRMRNPQMEEIASKWDLRIILGESTRTTMLRTTFSRQSTCPSLLLRRVGSPFPILLSSVTKSLNALCTRIQVGKAIEGGNPCHVLVGRRWLCFFLAPFHLMSSRQVSIASIPTMQPRIPNISSAFRRLLQHGPPVGNFCY